MSKAARDLAMAYAIKAKTGKKKMAESGPVSAKIEKRPSPTDRHDDSKDVAENEGKKPLQESKWTDRPDKASQKGMRTTPIKYPASVPSSVFSTRLRSQEDDLLESKRPNDGPQEEPSHEDNEMDAHKKGPSDPALKMKMMAKGGMINEEESLDKAAQDMQHDPARLESEDDSMGEPASDYDAGEMQPEHEDEEHPGSIAEAIMGRKAKMMAEGGVIEDPNKEHAETYDHDDEEVLKENLDEGMHSAHTPDHDDEQGDKLTDEDAHDMVSRIMKRAMRKSPMVK